MSTALTDRELEVLVLHTEGQTQRAMAESLGISQKEVKFVLAKLESVNKAHTIYRAHQSGVLPLPSVTGIKVLTDRETEALGCIAQGCTYQQTARALCISINSVKTLLKRINIKLKAKNSAHAVYIALQYGIIS